MKRNFFTYMLCLLVVGCSHIPLSTMLSMSTFDKKDFAELNARHIRAKIVTNISRGYVKDRTNLQVKLLTPSHKLDKTLNLIVVKDTISSEESWFGDTTLKHSTVFKLSEEAIKDFQELQQSPLIQKRTEDGKFNFKVRWQFEGGAPDNFTISADLLLDPEDGFFTLIDDYEFTQGQ
ncbi:hypothetical protein [Kangiella sediminilitoris]|uniref:Lipoprotein n=1 Tax=Kangiella sediminilitoris TaxID=1144748 RepID=A0A1B3B9B1_9GAMM|nr:hypothetical protein [Kangiella sediminilitoris]AOE49387.1 hypothetical protein KS2013_663 [Kangiella sediminilitoris]